MTFTSCEQWPQTKLMLGALREAVAKSLARERRRWCLNPLDLRLKAIPGRAAPYELQRGEGW